jgi:hypothetical protein
MDVCNYALHSVVNAGEKGEQRTVTNCRTLTEIYELNLLPIRYNMTKYTSSSCDLFVDRLCGLVVEFMAIDLEVWVRFPALPDFLKSSGSGTGSTQLREYN